DIKVKLIRNQSRDRVWTLEVENAGTAAGVRGSQIDVEMDQGSIESISPEPGQIVKALCRSLVDKGTPVAEPCSERRANLIRIEAAGLRPGQTLQSTLVLAASHRIRSFSASTRTDAGDRYVNQTAVIAQDGVDQ